MLPTLHIQLLGEFHLSVEGQSVEGQPRHAVNRPRQQELLAYLLLHRHAPQPRQQIAFRLWPDSSEAQAYTNLRKLIFQLRRALPMADSLLRADMQHVGWQPQGPYRLDVAELENALNALAQMATPDPAAVQAIVALYRGELLLSCYADWLLPLRRALHERVVNALETAIDGLVAQHDHAAARRVAEHLRRLDPLHEAAYRHLMRLRALEGNRAGAVRLYHECVTLLEQELGVAPATATQELYQRLLRAEPQPVAQPTPRPAQEPAPRHEHVPLVGRQPEWQQMQRAWQQMSSRGPHLVTVWGEAGMGKTRLVEELMRWARLRPGSVIGGRAYAAEGALSYTPLIEWLRSETLRPLLSQLDSAWQTELARLLPELLAAHGAPPPPMTEGWQRQRLHEALAQAVLAAPPSRLLVLDDLQWCDAETLAWLRYLMRFDPHAPLLVVSTARLEAVDDQHPLQQLVRQLQRAGQYTALELGPLSDTETAVLAGHLDAGQSPQWASRLYQESEGNPLFVVEMVRASAIPAQGPEPQAGAVEETVGNTGENTGENTVPPTIQAVIAARLAQLSPSALHLAQLAATVGRAFTFEVLVAAGDTDEVNLIQALDELWQRRIVREREQGYDFSHDKIREVVYNTTSSVRRRLLHRQVAQGLEEHHARQLADIAGQLATHYGQAGQPQKALAYSILAGERATQLSANHEALHYYQQALALVQDEPQRQRILAQRAQVYLNLYRGREAVADFQRLLEQAQAAGDRALEVEFMLGLVNAHYLVALDDQETGAADKVRALYVRVQQMARALGDQRKLVLSLLLPIWHFWPERRDQAMTDAQEAYTLSCDLGDADLIIDSKLALLYNSHEAEQATVGADLLAELRTREDLDRLNRATFYLMWTHYNLGNYAQAVSLCDAGIELAAKLGVLPVQYPTLKAFALLGRGHYGEAWDAVQQEIADDAHALGRAFQMTGIGMYFLYVGAYARAADLFAQGMEQADRLQRGWLREWARLHYVRALLGHSAHSPDAVAEAAQALAQTDPDVLQDLQPWYAWAGILEAQVSLATGTCEAALAQIDAATRFAAANGFRAHLVTALETRAQILVQADRPMQALATLDEALPLATTIEAASLLWRIHSTHALALECVGEADRAAQAGQQAALGIRRLAASIHNPEDRQGFLQDRRVAAILARAESMWVM